MAKRKSGIKLRQKGFVVDKPDKPKKYRSHKKDWFGARNDIEH
jgi:hypothetical protein